MDEKFNLIVLIRKKNVLDVGSIYKSVKKTSGFIESRSVDLAHINTMKREYGYQIKGTSQSDMIINVHMCNGF